MPVTVTCLGNYSILSEQRLHPRPAPSELRAVDHALALALGVRERLRQEVMQQDASKLQLGAETVDGDVREVTLDCGHFVAEEAADDCAAALLRFFGDGL